MKFSLVYLLLLCHSIGMSDAHIRKKVLRVPSEDDMGSNAITNERCTAGLVIKQGDHKMETSLSCFLSDTTVYDVNVDKSFITDNFINGPYKSGEFEFDIPKGAVFDRNARVINIPDEAKIILRKKKSGINNGRDFFNKNGQVRSVLIVRVEANDASTSASQSFLSDSVLGTNGDPVNLKTQTSACSHGQLSFTPTPDRPSKDSRPSITDGATTVSVNVSTSEGDRRMEDAISDELQSQFGVSEVGSLADHVLYCLPPNTMQGVAYGYVNYWLTVYNDNWCTYLSAQMHEIGHNLGLSHSGEGSDEYGDQSCMMSYSSADDDGPLMCYGAPKAWELGWYESKRVEISTTNPTYVGELAGYTEDMNDADVPPMLIKIDVDSTLVDYYLYFNRAEGFTSGTKEGANQVLISKWNSDGFNNSLLQAKLSEGDSWDIPGFEGSVIVTSIGTRATVAIQLFPSFNNCGSGMSEFKAGVFTDDWGDETGWWLKEQIDEGYSSPILRDKYLPSNTYVEKKMCISQSKCYKFKIRDEGNDGICCQEGNGWYHIKIDDIIIKHSTFEGSSNEVTEFCL